MRRNFATSRVIEMVLCRRGSSPRCAGGSAGSRRYADPASFLLTAEQWEPQRVEFCALVGKPAAAADALAMADDELHTALADVETLLAAGGDTGRSG